MSQPETEEDIDYTTYAHKAPTDLQARFVPWIIDKTGYDPNAAKNKAEAFAAGVRLAVALRMDFQASPENREATAAARQEREEAKARAKQEREAARAAKAAQRETAAAEPAEEAPATGRRAKPTKAAAAPANTAPPAKATGRGARRGARAATATANPAPF